MQLGLMLTHSIGEDVLAVYFKSDHLPDPDVNVSNLLNLIGSKPTDLLQFWCWSLYGTDTYLTPEMRAELGPHQYKRLPLGFYYNMKTGGMHMYFRVTGPDRSFPVGVDQGWLKGFKYTEITNEEGEAIKDELLKTGWISFDFESWGK